MNQNDVKEITFFVPGLPIAAGSKKGFVNRKTGGVIITDANKRTKPWQSQVRSAAATEMQDAPLMQGALALVVVFTMPRPKSHFGTGRNAGVLKESAPYFHTSPPDATKLTRAIEDAMTKVVWTDDALVAEQLIRKVYGDKPGASITVRRME